MTEEMNKLNEIIRLGSELNNIQDLDILLEHILTEARQISNADAGTIYIREGDELLFSHAQNDTKQKELPSGQKLIYRSFKVKINTQSIAGYVAAKNQPLNIPNMYTIPKNLPYSFDPQYDKKSGYKTVSTLTLPLTTNLNEVIGVLQVINCCNRKGNIIPFRGQEEPFVKHFSNIASIVLHRAKLTRAIILRMSRMAELRDPKETGAHVNRVAAYSIEFYERWAHYKKIPKAEVERNRDILRMAAMLHDVGKVAISDLILKKPGKLTPEEYDIMKTHTFIGARLFRDNESEFDKVAYVASLTHHENWNGTGYPGHIDLMTGEALEKDASGKAVGMKGEEIPLFGRVVALADVFDALSCQRVYKPAWKDEDINKEIRSLSGKKFDPDLVDIFFESREFIESIKQKYPDVD
ncbi:MAG: HD domain-containing protein [Spirochaetales bacterium]|nr:HD domain-containing protein [Spirochaetales bacterium]